jgi:hypothetical protein
MHMSLGKRLLESIRSGSLHVDWQCEDVSVDVEVEVSDRLSMLVRRIYVLGAKRDTTPLRLKKQAQAAIDRLTYLDTSLRLIEWDQISNMLQIRGRPDRAEGVPAQYFEIIVDRSPSILLHRRSGHETIPFHISKDCFVRIIDDLVRIVRS